MFSRYRIPFTVLLLTLIILSATPATAATWYVNSTYTGATRDGQPATPFTSLREAILSASDNDLICLAANGDNVGAFYSEDTGQVNPGIAGNNTYIINKPLTIQGGWRGTDEWDNQLSSEATVLRATETDCRVLLLTAAAAGSKLNNLTITGGRLSNSTDNIRHGGGLYIASDNVEINKCIVRDNSISVSVSTSIADIASGTGYGGGIYINSANAMLSECVIADNSIDVTVAVDISSRPGAMIGSAFSYSYGGGIYVTDGSDMITLRNCDIKDNSNTSVSLISGTATFGTSASGNAAGCGIYVADSNVLLSESNITNNSGTGTGSGAIPTNRGSVNGGGIYIYGGNTTLNKCNIADNSGSGSSSGVGGGVYLNQGDVTANECYIVGNSISGHGGGIYTATNSTAELTACTIAANSAQGSGGGACTTANVSLTACTIVANLASNGGGLYADDSGAAAGAEITVLGCTIAANKAVDSGGGMYQNILNASNVALTASLVIGNIADTGGDINISTGDCELNWLSYVDLSGALSANVNSNRIPAATVVNYLLDYDASIADNAGHEITTSSASAAYTNFLRKQQPTDPVPTIQPGLAARMISMDILTATAAIDALGVTRPVTDQTAGAVELDNITIVWERDKIYVDSLFNSHDLNAKVGTPDNPYNSLSTALYFANDSAIIYLAARDNAGAYTAISKNNSTLIIDKPLIIQGGWDGDNTGWDDNLHPITTAATVLQAATDSRVLKISANTVTARYLTITGGTIENIAAGGGIYVDTDITDLLIDTCTIYLNSGDNGGGIYVNAGAAVILANSTIAANSATTAGGGIYVDQSASVKLLACTVAVNKATIGSGLYSADGITTIISSLLAGNKSGSDYEDIFISTSAAHLEWSIYGSANGNLDNNSYANKFDQFNSGADFVTALLVGFDSNLDYTNSLHGVTLIKRANSGVTPTVAVGLAAKFVDIGALDSFANIFAIDIDANHKTRPLSNKMTAGAVETTQYLTNSIYVDSNWLERIGGSDALGSYKNPLSSLSMALALADPGNNTTIYLAARDHGDGNVYTTTNSRTGNLSTFTIDKKMIIQGGWAGQDSDAAFTTPEIMKTTLITAATNSRVMTITSDAGEVTLKNVHLTGGDVSGKGGGIWVDTCALSLIATTVSGNQADDQGGGVYLQNSQFSLQASTLSGNVATDGGALAADTDSSIDMVLSTLAGNHASNSGGGVYAINLSDTVSIIGCILLNNTTAFTAGIGANYNLAGTPVVISASLLDYDDAAIIGDSSNHGVRQTDIATYLPNTVNYIAVSTPQILSDTNQTAISYLPVSTLARIVPKTILWNELNNVQMVNGNNDIRSIARSSSTLVDRYSAGAFESLLSNYINPDAPGSILTDGEIRLRTGDSTELNLLNDSAGLNIASWTYSGDLITKTETSHTILAGSTHGWETLSIPVSFGSYSYYETVLLNVKSGLQNAGDVVINPPSAEIASVDIPAVHISFGSLVAPDEFPYSDRWFIYTVDGTEPQAELHVVTDATTGKKNVSYNLLGNSRKYINQFSIDIAGTVTVKVCAYPNPDLFFINADGTTIQESGELTANIGNSVSATYSWKRLYDDFEPIQQLTIIPATLLLEPGDTQQLTVDYTPVYATNKVLTWQSTSNNIASVDSQGKVTAKAIGQAAIYAYAQDGSGVSAQAQVLVVAKPIPTQALSFSSTTLAVSVGKTLNLSDYLVFEPIDATDRQVDFSLNNPDLALLTSNSVKGLSEGETLLTARLISDPTIFCSCTLLVTAAPLVPEIVVANDNLELTVGDMVDLDVAIVPAPVHDPIFNFSSSHPDLVAVDADGTLTVIVNPDQNTVVTITVSCNDPELTTTVEVTVKHTTILLQEIALDCLELNLEVDDYYSFDVAFNPADASNKTLFWTVHNNPDTLVLTINDSGTIIAHNPGHALVTVISEDGGHTASCLVTVREKSVPLMGIALDRQELTLLAGDYYNFSVTFTPDNASDKTISWSADNGNGAETSVIAIDAAGRVTALAAGDARVTVVSVSGGFSASCAVTVIDSVVPNPPTSVSLQYDLVVVAPGRSWQLVSSVLPVGCDPYTTEWSSSDNNIVSVNNSGVVTGHSYGQATVSLKIDNLTPVSCQIVVTVDVAQYDNVAAFLTRFYRIYLNRDPDLTGLWGWLACLVQGKCSGREAVWGFVNSQEYAQIGDDNSTFVDKMYRTFFGQTSDQRRELGDYGPDAWANLLNTGVLARVNAENVQPQPTEILNVFDGFTGAREFTDLCAMYGIKPY